MSTADRGRDPDSPGTIMHALIRLGVLLTALFGFSATTLAGDLYIASWNVENLFDTVDDPKVKGDEEFTPDGPKKYTEIRYKDHLKLLAKVIAKMNGGKGPDVLGVCEIENRTVLVDLIAELKSLKRDYQIVHQDSPSDRGIDTAILYDANVFKLASSKFHAIKASKNTRDIAEAELTLDGKTLTVFMNHWPARSNPENDRIIAAKTLRARIDEILKDRKDADIIAMGDFNDYPTDVSIIEHLKALDHPDKLPEGAFYDTMWPTHHAKKGTYVFKNQWEVIDHLMVSPGLLDKKDFRWKANSTAPIADDFQLFTPKDTTKIPHPNRMYSGNVYHRGGISDHLPIGCVIQW
jgi:predicted extracellular nuclease